MKHDRKRSAFLVADAMTGIAILGTLLGIFAAALGQSNVVANKLSDSHAAWRSAEAALADMQAGHQTKLAEIQPVAGGAAPTGFVWVEAVAKRGAQEARLIGLVPKSMGGTP